jgi:hypothetical protein
MARLNLVSLVLPPGREGAATSQEALGQRPRRVASETTAVLATRESSAATATAKAVPRPEARRYRQAKAQARGVRTAGHRQAKAQAQGVRTAAATATERWGDSSVGSEVRYRAAGRWLSCCHVPYPRDRW